MSAVVVTSSPPMRNQPSRWRRSGSGTGSALASAARLLSDGRGPSAPVPLGAADGRSYPRIRWSLARPPARSPTRPGSYQFKDALGRVIYVGKASSLRQRLSNYFQDPRNLHPRTAQMVATAESVEWIEVRNEVEALMLEWTLIKQHRPRFNIRLRDDKSYPFLAVTLDEQFPRALVMRGRKRKGTRYFGPYAHAYAIRDTLDLLLRSFPIRTCSPGKYNEHHRLGRPCLLFHIEKCSGPCVGEIDEHDYRRLVDELCDFLDGDTDEIVRRLSADMRAAAADLEYERAARLRDRLQAVQRAIEKQQMVAETQRGHRRHRHRRRRAGGRRPGVLRAPRPGGRAQGLRPRQGGGRQRRRPRRPDHGGDVRRRAAARRAQAGARPGGQRRRGHLRGVAHPPARQPGAGARPPARRQARAARDGDAQRQGGVRPPPPASRRRPQRPQPGAHRAAGPAAAARGAAAHRVLRHGPPAGHRLRRLDGRARGRPAEQARVPPVQGQGRAGQRRLRGDGGGAHPPPDGVPQRARPPARRRARRRRPSPAEALPVPAAAAARRRRQGAAGRGRAGGRRRSGWPTRSRSPRWPSASRRSTCPAAASRSTCRGGATRCSCSSGSATRPTASPTRSTASCAASG